MDSLHCLTIFKDTGNGKLIKHFYKYAQKITTIKTYYEMTVNLINIYRVDLFTVPKMWHKHSSRINFLYNTNKHDMKLLYKYKIHE